MTFHMLWGLILWFSISKYGLGISTDSSHLLFAALNLSQGRGLFSFDGSFVSLWPPLYPMLLALIHLVTGFDPFVSATILQAISFLGISICLSILFLRIFPENFYLALSASILSDIGMVVPDAFLYVGSDYVHLFLVLLFVVLAGYYLETRSPRFLLGMSVVGMLSMLQRYLGVAAIATGTVLVFFSSTEDIRRRIARSGLMALAILPAGIWLLATSRLTNQRAPVSFGENFSWFSRSILEWFFEPQAIQHHLNLDIVVLWLIIGGLVALLLGFSTRKKALSSFEISLFAYGTIYILALFGSASITYFNKLSGRFLLPIYVPLITLLAVVSGTLIQRAEQLTSRSLRQIISFGMIGIGIAAAGFLSRVTVPLILESHADGAPGSFNTKAWHENSVVNYWLAHEPQGNYLLFSNYPDGVAFYTWHDCDNAPAEYSGPYGKTKFPVSDYSSELFSSGLDVYLIWFEPNMYSYYYTAQELSPIAQIEPLFVSRDGGIYRLLPVKKNP
ncbi:MAG TPA: hypothetical protein VLX61_14810 [Anaerolineales bacterium]|nr:hypothetical protein [Anaerolineales bacterium]